MNVALRGCVSSVAKGGDASAETLAFIDSRFPLVPQGMSTSATRGATYEFLASERSP